MSRIVHIGPSGLPVLSDLGGAVQRRMWELARAQVRAGHEVTVVSPADADATTEVDGVRLDWTAVRARRPLRDYELLVRARRRLRRRGVFDVLHAHGSPDAGRMLRGIADTSVHSVDFFRYRATSSELGHRYYTGSLNAYDVTMPVSAYCRDALKAFYPGLRSRVAVVHNGVDLQQFRPDPVAAEVARAELALPAGPLVVYLGRIIEQKGSDLLGPLAGSLRVSGAAKVVAVGPSGQFGTTDPGRLVESLQQQGVVCTGAVEERLLAGVLNAASVVVLPTRHDEMFGMAAVEASACGTPIVASDLGGIPEAVGPGGLLFAPGVADEFVGAVTGLLGDPTARESLGRAARHHAEGFAWARVCEATSIAYASGGSRER